MIELSLQDGPSLRRIRGKLANYAEALEELPGLVQRVWVLQPDTDWRLQQIGLRGSPRLGRRLEFEAVWVSEERWRAWRLREGRSMPQDEYEMRRAERAEAKAKRELEQ